jgi:hypothetical protein
MEPRHTRPVDPDIERLEHIARTVLAVGMLLAAVMTILVLTILSIVVG